MTNLETLGRRVLVPRRLAPRRPVPRRPVLRRLGLRWRPTPLHRLRTGQPLAVVLLGGLAVAFLVAPVAALLLAAAPGLAHTFGAPETRALLLRSLACAGVAAGLSLLAGVPLALLLVALPVRARRLLRAAVMVPMVLPPVIGGVGLLLLLAPHGVLGRPLAALGIRVPFSTVGVVLAQLFVALPLLVLSVESALRSVDPALLDAGRALGMAPALLARRVLLPCARGGVAAGVVLAFTRALGEFGATVTLAGDLPGVTRTLPLAVYAQLPADPTSAYALAGVLVAVSILTLVAMRDRWLGTP